MKAAVLTVFSVLLLAGGAYWVGEQKARNAEIKVESLNEKIVALNNDLATKTARLNQLEAAEEAVKNSTIDDFAKIKRDRDSKWLEKDSESATSGVADPASFLESVRIGDVFTEIRLAKKFSEVPETLKRMTGVYKGKLKVENHPSLVLELNLKLEDALWDDQLKGKLIIRLLENGQEFVSSGNEGKLEAISQLDGSTGFLFHARPTHYFQVYSLPNARSLIGNYYRQTDKAGTYEFLGSFELNRR